MELPGERNVAALGPPGTDTGDLRAPVAMLGDGILGDFSLGSRARGSAIPGGYLVGDIMLSLARSGLGCLSMPGWAAGARRGGPGSGLESRGEIWRERGGRSPGEVDNTCCANLGRRGEIHGEIHWGRGN